jgi:hypothetical protein
VRYIYIYWCPYIYILFTTNNLQNMFTKHNETTRQQLATAMWEWDGVWYTILYTHGPLQSVDHLYVKRNIPKPGKQEKRKETMYVCIKWKVEMSYGTSQCHKVIESQSDMIGYTCALSAWVHSLGHAWSSSAYWPHNFPTYNFSESPFWSLPLVDHDIWGG